MNRPLWQPSPERIARANLTSFILHVRRQWGADAGDFASLYRWSVSEPEQFWQSVWSFCQVIGERGAGPALIDGQKMPGARWFPQARLNFAENLLRRRDRATALAFWGENRIRSRVTFGELHAEVSRVAQALRAAGVGPGDRVAGYMPNVPGTVIAMLASASIGATWSSCSPDFGVQGVLDRFGQIEPKVLFAADGYVYNRHHLDTTAKMREVAERVPSISRVIWVSLLDAVPAGGEGFDAVAAADVPPLEFIQRAFDDPLYVMYSSGTTGMPKCIVHGIGGTLIQHLKEHRLHCNLSADDVLFFFTTCGWMMWNWLVSGLASGAALVLYDGSPFRPSPSALMDLAERERITVFGASAKYLSALEKTGRKPVETHDLSAMRMLLSTGSPLTPDGFRYVYRSVKPDVHLASISGGTDLISCFVLGAPTLPVYEGEIQCAGLGMAVDVFGEAGRPLRGAKGELVCTRAFPSCPIGFWNDPDGSRLHDAYFARFPGVWAHGDFAEVTEHGGYVIYGRSDAVLNPGGVRIGTAEIYPQVEQLEEIEESVCVGQEWEGDVRVVLFVVMRQGHVLDDALRVRIRDVIKNNASPRHVPAKILDVTDIPRTLSGKIVELAVRDVIHGRTVANTSALANPEALDQFKDRLELTT